MLNHREYVGGDWENIGKWQMETLQKLPEFHKDCKFLDIACGSLRLGSLLIPYLNEGKYHGLDNNYEILMAGVNQELVHGKEKNPKFLVNDKFDFSFCPQFDIAWANSLFSHLTLQDIRICFENLTKVAKLDSVFYFTYFYGDSKYNPQKSHARLDFNYHLKEIQEVVLDWKFIDLGLRFEHPRKQQVVKAVLK